MIDAIVADIYKIIDTVAPFSSAEEFDNSGIIIGNSRKPVKKILCALDCTPDVVEESKRLNADLIISHHPLMFRAKKAIDPDDYEGRAITSLLKNNICLIAAHTNLDKSLFSPSIGLAKKMQLNDITCVSDYMVCGILKDKLVVNELIELLEQSVCPKAILYGIPSKIVKKVAIAGGAYSEGYSEALEIQADVFITGEVKHNHAIESVFYGQNILEIGHYYSEVYFLDEFCTYLQSMCNDLEYGVTVSVSTVIPF